MLNKNKVLEKLENILPKFFKDSSEEIGYAIDYFSWLIDNSESLEKINELSSSDWIIPSWIEEFKTKTKIDSFKKPYTVLSVDGSQIYPDKHQGVSFYLINMGIAQISYGSNSYIKFDSIPSIHTEAASKEEASRDIVNSKRTELEFKTGLEIGNSIKSDNNTPIFLFDGSLIFWHLDNKEPEIKYRFLSSYIALLDQFFQDKIPIAGYISLPKSKEIINIIRTGLDKNIIPVSNQITDFNYTVDADIFDDYLKLHERSAIFSNCSSISKHYPDHLKPEFFYLNVENEVARIEFPRWIRENKNLFDFLCKVILDQCMKGQGYPVVLSEAHEQAVIKNSDREFFYFLLKKMGLKFNHKFSYSQKNIKKRLVGI